MEDTKAYEEFLTLPDGYVVHLMVMHEPVRQRGRGRQPKQWLYRSRIWIGTEQEEEPLVHRSQEHSSLQGAVDACWQMLQQSAPQVMVATSVALRQIVAATNAYFRAEPQPI